MSNGNETNDSITRFVRQASNGSFNTQDGSYPHIPKTTNGNSNNNNMPRLFARQLSNRGVDGNNNDTDENSNTMITMEPLNYIKYLHSTYDIERSSMY